MVVRGECFGLHCLHMPRVQRWMLMTPPHQAHVVVSVADAVVGVVIHGVDRFEVAAVDSTFAWF